MDDDLWQSKKGQRTGKGFPYSPTDLLESDSSSDDESRRKTFEDIQNSSPSSSSGASSDDNSSSYEYRWEEAKPAKPPFQPFVTSVNVGKIELPAVKREFFAVIPLKAVLVILFPNNTPEDLELGIKKLELHSLTTFEAELLTNYVRGLRESDIPTFIVGDEIYVAEFCRGEIGCSYESLKAKFTAIMNSLLNEVPNLEQDSPVYADILRVDKLHIDEPARAVTVTYPPPAVCSLPKLLDGPGTKTLNEGRGKGANAVNKEGLDKDANVVSKELGKDANAVNIEGLGKGANAANKDDSEAMQTGDSDTPCDSLVQLQSCFPKKDVIAHVGEKIPEEQTFKKRKHGRRTSSETSFVNCPEDAAKETSRRSRSRTKIKVAVVLKHLFPENEEDEESSMDSDNVVRKDKESGSFAASTSKESTDTIRFPGQETRKTPLAVGGGVLKRQESEIDSTVCKNKSSTILADVVKGSLITSGTASDSIGIADQPGDTWESMLSAEITSATHQITSHESESCVNFDRITSGMRDGIEGDNVDGESTRVCGDGKDPCSLTSSSRGLPCENSKAAANSTEIHHSGSQADLLEEKSGDLRILVNDLRDKSRTTPEVRPVQPEATEICKTHSAKFRNSAKTLGDIGQDATEPIEDESVSNLSRTITFERRPFANDVNLPTNESAKHLANSDLASIDNGSGSPNPEWTVTDSYICGSPETIEEKTKVMSPVRSGNAANSKRSRDQVNAIRDEELSSKGGSTSSLRRRDKTLGRSNNKARSPKMDSGCQSDSRTRLRRDDRSRSTSSTDSRRRAQRTPTKSDNVSWRKWRPEEMYGGSGQRVISFGDRNRIVQRTTRYVPDYSRLRFHYRPELYSPVSSSETDFDDFDDDDCIPTRKTKQKVLRRKSTRDNTRVRCQRLGRETSATRSDSSSGKASVRTSGTEQSMPKQWGGRGGAFPRFPVRREPSVESEDVKSIMNLEEVDSIVPGLSNDIESLIVGIRRKCERESPARNIRRISESPRRTRSRRRSLSPPCARSFSPSPRQIGSGLRSRRRSLTPTSNATERDGYFGYPRFSRDRTRTPRFVTKSAFFSAKSIYLGANERVINRQRDGNTFKNGGGVLAVTGEGSVCNSSHSSEIHYSSTHHNTKLRDDSHTTNAGVCGSDELTHSRYCSPFKPFVQSYRSGKSSSVQLSMHEPTRGYVNAQGWRATGAADSAICRYNFLLPPRSLSDDEQVIILKDPQELDSSVGDLWPFLSVGSDHESSMDDSCDGEVEGLMFNKLTRLRRGSHCALDTAETLDSNFVSVSAASTNNVAQCDGGLPTRDVARNRKSDCYTGLHQNTRDERDNDITRSIDVSNGKVVGENVEGSTCGESNECKLDPSHGLSVPITVELKSKRKDLHGDGLLECDTAVDSPCAYEEVVMQDHDSDLYSANTVMLQEGLMGDASEMPDVSERFAKTVTKEIPISSSLRESGTKDNFPISACDIVQNDETEALDDAALGQDGMCVGATITIEGERQIVELKKIKIKETAVASSSSKSWKKLLLLKAQSDPSNNNAVDDKVAGKGTVVVEQIAMCTTSVIARDNKHVVGAYVNDRQASETAVFAELKSSDGRGEEERAASTINENVKFDYGENKLRDPPQGSAPSSRKGLELSDVRGDKEIEALTMVTQNEKHFAVNDRTGKFADLSESSAPSSKEESSAWQMNQKKTKSKSIHSNEADLVVVGGSRKFDDFTESAAAVAKKGSESNGMLQTLENRTEQNTAIEMRENTVKELDQSVPLPTAAAIENDASSKEDEEVEPARNSAVEITKNSQESSDTVTIEKCDVGMQKDLSPVISCTNQQYRASEVHIETGKRTQLLVTSTPVQSTVTDNVSSLLANNPCVTPLKVTVPAVPTTVNITRVTAVTTRSDALSTFPELKITVRATSQSVTAPLATGDLGAVDFKQKERIVLATPATPVELPAISPEQSLVDVTVARRSETRSSHDILGRKLGLPQSLVFSTVVRNVTVRDLPSAPNTTLASRKTFRGPQVKHKSVLQKTAVTSSDARSRSSSLPDQPSLISKRPEFMSSKAPTPFDISSTSHFASSPPVCDTRAPSPSVVSSSENGSSWVAGNAGVLTDSTPYLNHDRLGDDRIRQSNMNCNRTKEIVSTVAQNPTSSVLPEKPLKSILRKPTVSFDANVCATPSDNDSPIKTFDECLQDGEDVIQSLLPLIKKRKYTPRKKRGSSLNSQTVRPPAVSTSSRGRPVKRTALRGKGRPKRRKRLPSISSDEDIIDELSAGTSQSLPKATKVPPTESEMSEQDDGDEDLVSFMGVVSERTTTEATEIIDEADVTAGNEAPNDDGGSVDDNILLDAESDSEEDMRPLSELAKCITYSRQSQLQDNKIITANEGSVQPNMGNSNRIDAHDNIFTKMSVEMQAQDDENEASPTNLDSLESASANENFERSLVEMENKGVRERGIKSESPVSHVNECTPKVRDSITTSNAPYNISNTEKAIKQPCGQDEHHRVSEKTVGIPHVASNQFCEMGDNEVQPLLLTPPTSPKSDETRPTAEFSAASVASTSVGSPMPEKQVAVVQPVSGDDLKQTCSPQKTRNNQEMAAVQPVVSCDSNPILGQQNARREMPERREEVFHAPVSSGAPDLSLSTEHSQEIAGYRKVPDGISNLIAAAAELVGLTDSGCNANGKAYFTRASAVNHELKTVEPQDQEANKSRPLVETPTEKSKKRKCWTPFENYNMPEAESCHGFLEVCMSAPLQMTYALRRIPYVKTTTTTTHNAKDPSTSAGLNSSQDYSSILPTSSACATYLRLRDVICLIKVHPEALFSLVTRCEAALYSPNEYTRRLFAVVYDPVCVGDENMSKMWMRHLRCQRLQAFLDYMIILDKFLHSLLPRFYFEALGVRSVDVPKFVNVKIFKPIPDINEEVVQIFRQPYEYNSILRNKDDKIKCNTMQRRKFSLSTSNARKRSHSSDSSGSAKVAPTAHQPQKAVPAPLSTVSHKALYDDHRIFPLGQHPHGFYLSSEAPRFAYVPRNVGMDQCDLSSTPPPLYEKQIVLERPKNATGMNGAICFRRPNFYAVSQSQHSATVSSQHLDYRGVSSGPYVTAMAGSNVLRYTGVQDRQYVVQNTRPMHNPQPYVHGVRPQHPQQLSYARNDVGAAQSSPTSRQNPSRSNVEESISITSVLSQQETSVKKNPATIKEIVCNYLKNAASSNVLTTNEILKDLPHILRQKSEEGGKVDESPTVQNTNDLSGIDMLAEAAAKVCAMSGDDEDMNLKMDIEWDQASTKYPGGTDSSHLSGVASNLQSGFKPEEVHNIKAKRRRKDSGSKKTKAPKANEPRRELIWKPLLDSN